LPAFDITVPQIALRAVIVFVIGLIIVRFAARRFMGRSSPFDFVVAVIIGSSMSRTITGNTPLLATLVSIAVVIALHWCVSILSLYSTTARQVRSERPPPSQPPVVRAPATPRSPRGPRRCPAILRRSDAER
jgi:uncharacterized membrane protein YcaP (DUF421 family)